LCGSAAAPIARAKPPRIKADFFNIKSLPAQQHDERVEGSGI
jgi:hypothetical protein